MVSLYVNVVFQFFFFPDTHPGAGGDYDPWMLPDPKRDFAISIGFALQRANARMVRDAHFRRRKNRAGERYASGVEVGSDSPSFNV